MSQEVTALLHAARNSAPAVYELPDAHQHRVRADRGELAERQVLALEAIAASLSRIAAPQPPVDSMLTMKEVASLLTVSEDLIEKLMKSGEFRQGRHFLKLNSRVIFPRNLAELLFEDQLSIEATPLLKAQEKNEEGFSSEGNTPLGTNNSHQAKSPKQSQRATSNNRSGLDFGRDRRAS